MESGEFKAEKVVRKNRGRAMKNAVRCVFLAVAVSAWGQGCNRAREGISAGGGEETARRTGTIHRARARIVVDGNITDAEWSRAEALQGGLDPGAGFRNPGY